LKTFGLMEHPAAASRRICLKTVVQVSVRRIHTCQPWYSEGIAAFSQESSVGKTGRPGPTLDDYLYWQERLEGRGASGLSIDELMAGRFWSAHPSSKIGQ
jgi:hypothetical protein